MANLCTNIFYCSTNKAENITKIEQFLCDRFDMEYYTSDGDSIEGEFYSKWSFPEEEFTQLLSLIAPDDNLYIRVLSYEFGCEYASFRIYRHNEWETIM